MKKINFSHLSRMAKDSFSGVLAIAATTLLLLALRQDIVGQGVIALILLLPVIGVAYHFGLAAGMSAALTAALCFDFFFIPPFYTFNIGSLEGWLILVIFFAVAIIVVERIQATLSKARASEREAVMMYEFSTILSGLRTKEAIARHVARFIRQRYLAKLVSVLIQPKDPDGQINAYEPPDGEFTTRPDCVLPIINSWGLVGDIQIWSGDVIELQSSDSRLFRNIALQVGLAIERVQITEFEFQQTTAHEIANGKTT
jgi:K+-sensing histidine kinase KdpD